MGEREERSYTDATAGLPVPKVTAEREVHLCIIQSSVQAAVEVQCFTHRAQPWIPAAPCTGALTAA